LVEAFRTYGGQGIPEDRVIDLCASHAIQLMQEAEQHKEWFEKKKKSAGEYCPECGEPWVGYQG
jgi:hypothetical protein